MSLSCDICHKKFARTDSLYRHKRTAHGEKNLECSECKKLFHRLDVLQKHEKTHLEPKKRKVSPKIAPPAKKSRPNPPSENQPRSCLNTFTTVQFLPDDNNKGDIPLFLHSKETELKEQIEEAATTKRGVKYYLNLAVQLSRKISPDKDETCVAYFRSLCEVVLLESLPNLQAAFDKVSSKYLFALL